MQKKPHNIILIGPGSVGKSTVGKELAQLLGYENVDIDDVFCERIENIGIYLDKNGYYEYARANSSLTQQFRQEHVEYTIFITPSGFLDQADFADILTQNSDFLSCGTVILLLPENEPTEQVVNLVVDRQIKRYPELARERDNEEKKYILRHNSYKKYADIIIISGNSEPQQIAEKIKSKLGW